LAKRVEDAAHQYGRTVGLMKKVSPDRRNLLMMIRFPTIRDFRAFERVVNQFDGYLSSTVRDLPAMKMAEKRLSAGGNVMGPNSGLKPLQPPQPLVGIGKNPREEGPKEQWRCPMCGANNGQGKTRCTAKDNQPGVTPCTGTYADAVKAQMQTGQPFTHIRQPQRATRRNEQPVLPFNQQPVANPGMPLNMQRAASAEIRRILAEIEDGDECESGDEDCISGKKVKKHYKEPKTFDQ
jgi:hypothetical protein